ncbi:MAG TPA: hypothetical protein PKA41_20175, partial [Verrucomicrobiota bacterium]|nr:hypothetical protein [Verrucomicrobiota bacterium]
VSRAGNDTERITHRRLGGAWNNINIRDAGLADDDKAAWNQSSLHNDGLPIRETSRTVAGHFRPDGRWEWTTI